MHWCVIPRRVDAADLRAGIIARWDVRCDGDARPVGVLALTSGYACGCGSRVWCEHIQAVRQSTAPTPGQAA